MSNAGSPLRNRQAGFSLAELVVTIGILALLLTLASLAQSRLVPHYRLSAATRQVVTDLRMMRSKAVAQNASMRMIFTANGDSYSAERWNVATDTWEPFALYQRGDATDMAAVPIELPSGVTTTGATTVEFAARGSAATTGTVPLVLSAPGPRTRTLSINVAGLISVS